MKQHSRFVNFVLAKRKVFNQIKVCQSKSLMWYLDHIRGRTTENLLQFQIDRITLLAMAKEYSVNISVYYIEITWTIWKEKKLHSLSFFLCVSSTTKSVLKMVKCKFLWIDSPFWNGNSHFQCNWNICVEFIVRLYNRPTYRESFSSMITGEIIMKRIYITVKQSGKVHSYHVRMDI